MRLTSFTPFVVLGIASMRPNRLFTTASFRLTLLYATWFSLSALVLFGFIYWVVTDYTARQLDASIVAQVTSLRQDAGPQSSTPFSSLIGQRSEAPGGREFAYLLQDASGVRIAGTLPPMTPAVGWQELPYPETAGVDEGDGHGWRALGTSLDDGSFLLVARDIYQIDEVLDLMERIFGWGFAVTLVLAFVGGAVVSAGFLRRLDTINRTCREIVDGNLSRRVPTAGSGDDFDQLSANLNRMLDRIQTLMENLRQVTNDIAHDLRTPLSRLRLRLEGVRAGARSPVDYEAATDHAIAEIDAVLGTFNALLRIAQIESGSRRAGFATVDLSALTQSIVETYVQVAEDQGHTLTATIAPDITILGDRELLAQLLVNLVENALCHTPCGSIIKVGLSALESEAGPRLIVADNGPGIPVGERDKVLQRFHRLDGSRATPGSGLGLCLVAAVAELHGAAVTLEDNGPGLRVIVGDTKTTTALQDRLTHPEPAAPPCGPGFPLLSDPRQSAPGRLPLFLLGGFQLAL